MNNNSKRYMKTNNFIKVFLVLAVAGVFTACSGGAPKTEESAASVEVERVRVKALDVYEEDVDQLGTFTASVEANITNNISPKVSTRIKEVLVEVGDKVKEGDVVAKMDAINLVQARMQMTNDSIEFARMDELYKVGGISKSQWDARNLAYNISKTNFANLMENTVLVSPIDGVVTARNYDNGDVFSMGQPLYVVEEITPVKLMVNVSEGLYTKVKEGMSVDVLLSVYPNEIFKGKVRLVYPSLDATTRTFPVEVIIDNKDEKVRPGMFARVTFNYGTESNVVVPDVAIVKQAGSGDKYIYTIENGKAVMNKVTLGRRVEKEYEVLSGIESGAKVIIEGQSHLSNGAEVVIVK